MPEWFAAVIPFVKGAVGWSAGSFAYENFVKPSRSRRQLARVLAEEVQQIMTMLVLQQEAFEVTPNTIPADFKLHDAVYRSLLARVGELSGSLPGELILFYQRVETINNERPRVNEMIDGFNAARRDPDRHGGMAALEDRREMLRRSVIVFKAHFPVTIQHSDRVLRALRIEETPLGRVGYFFRSKPMLEQRRARADVRRALERLEPPRR